MTEPIQIAKNLAINHRVYEAFGKIRMAHEKLLKLEENIELVKTQLNYLEDKLRILDADKTACEVNLDLLRTALQDTIESSIVGGGDDW